MSLRAAIGLDHLIKAGVINSGQGATWEKGIENLFALYANPVSTAKRALITEQGWFGAQQVNASVVLSAIFESSKLVKGDPAVSWMGLRFKIVSVGSLAGNNTICWLAARNYPSNTTFSSIFTAAELISFLGLPNLAALAGQTGYFEFAIDWKTYQLHRRLNGRDISSVSIVAGLRTMVDNKTICAFIPSSSAPNHVMETRDFYWVDNDGVGLQGPLGPQRLIQLEETVDEPTNWTPTVGDKATFFSANPHSATAVDTPTINVGTPVEALSVSLKLPTNAAFDKINAVVSAASAISTTGTPSLRSSFKQGTQSAYGANAPVLNTMQHNLRGVIAEKAVDNTDWNRQKIDATKLVLESV